MNLSSVSGKNWIFKKFNSSDVIKFTEDFSLTETVAKLLSIRKMNIDDINLFLNPKIKNFLPNPAHLQDMKKAIDRTYKSIINDEFIGIFGDFFTFQITIRNFFPKTLRIQLRVYAFAVYRLQDLLLTDKYIL